MELNLSCFYDKVWSPNYSTQSHLSVSVNETSVYTLYIRLNILSSCLHTRKLIWTKRQGFGSIYLKKKLRTPIFQSGGVLEKWESVVLRTRKGLHKSLCNVYIFVSAFGPHKYTTKSRRSVHENTRVIITVFVYERQKNERQSDIWCYNKLRLRKGLHKSFCNVYMFVSAFRPRKYTTYTFGPPKYTMKSPRSVHENKSVIITVLV